MNLGLLDSLLNALGGRPSSAPLLEPENGHCCIRFHPERSKRGRGLLRRRDRRMATVSVRYIVDDVDAAIAFYCGQLGFTRGDAPGADVRDAVPRRPAARRSARRAAGRGGGQAMPDGTRARAGRLEPLRARGRRPRRRPSRRCARQARTSATTSSPASAASRSWSRTRPATPSSSSSRSCPRRYSNRLPEHRRHAGIALCVVK